MQQLRRLDSSFFHPTNLSYAVELRQGYRDRRNDLGAWLRA